MKAHTIVFHGDLFEVELTKQEEFLFRIDDGDAVAADILSRKDAVALIEWLRYHLAQPEDGVIYKMEQCALHMGRPIIHQAACYPAIRTVCPNCQEERREPQSHAGTLICQECGADRADPYSACPKGPDHRCPMIAKA